MKRFAISVFVVLVTLAALALAWRWRGVFLIFILSLGVAAALRPLVERLVDRGVRRRIGLGIVYFLSVVAIGLVLLLMADPLAIDGENLSNDFTAAHAHVTEAWPQGSTLQKIIAERLPPPERLEAVVTGALGVSPAAWLLTATVNLAGLLIDGVLVIVLSLYWSIDRVHFERTWLSLLSVDRRATAREIWRTIELEIGAYIRSEVLQSLAAGILLYVGFRVIGYPYPALLAVLGGLAWMLPWVGGVVTVCAALVLAFSHAVAADANYWLTALPATLYTFVVLTFLEFFIEPRFFNRQRYNSLLIVMLAIGLMEWAGPLGLLIAPPLAAALQILFEHLIARRNMPEPLTVPEGMPETFVRLSELRRRISVTEQPPHVLNLMERLEDVARRSQSVLRRNRRPVRR